MICDAPSELIISKREIIGLTKSFKSGRSLGNFFYFYFFKFDLSPLEERQEETGG